MLQPAPQHRAQVGRGVLVDGDRRAARRDRAGRRPAAGGARPGSAAAARAGRAGVGLRAARRRSTRAQPGRDVGVVVEARAPRRASGRLSASSRPYRSAMQPVATTLAPVSAAASSVSIESCLAFSTKPQVLTTTTSAPSPSGVSAQPSASSRAASSSESTSLRAQPRVSSATRWPGGEVDVAPPDNVTHRAYRPRRGRPLASARPSRRSRNFPEVATTGMVTACHQRPLAPALAAYSAASAGHGGADSCAAPDERTPYPALHDGVSHDHD